MRYSGIGGQAVMEGVMMKNQLSESQMGKLHLRFPNIKVL